MNPSSSDFTSIMGHSDTLPIIVGIFVILIAFYYQLRHRISMPESSEISSNKEQSEEQSKDEINEQSKEMKEPRSSSDSRLSTPMTTESKIDSTQQEMTANAKSLRVCAHCNIPATLRCGKCKNVYYCNSEHQRIDWKRHQANDCVAKSTLTAAATDGQDLHSDEHEKHKESLPTKQSTQTQIVKPAIPFKSSPCAVCHEVVAHAKRCAKCKKVFYCSVEHQKQDWKNHKKNCEIMPAPDLSFPWIMRVNVPISDILHDSFDAVCKYLCFPFGAGRIDDYCEFVNHHTLSWICSDETPSFASTVSKGAAVWSHEAVMQGLDANKVHEIARAYQTLLVAGRSLAFVKAASVLMVMLQRSGKLLVHQDHIIEDFFVAEGTIHTPSLVVISASNQETVTKAIDIVERQSGWSSLSAPSIESPHVLGDDSPYQPRICRTDAGDASISVLPGDLREYFIVCRASDGSQFVMDCTSVASPDKSLFTNSRVVPMPYPLTDAEPSSDLVEITNTRDIVSDLAHSSSQGILPSAGPWLRSITTAYLYALEDLLLEYPVSAPEGFLNVAIRPMKDRLSQEGIDDDVDAEVENVDGHA